MSAEKSSTPELRDTCPASKRPNSRIAEANNKVWITTKKIISQPIEFMFEFLADVFGLEQGREAGDAFSAWATEVFDVIAGWVGGEDVGAIDFGVEVPDRGDCGWVVGGVVAMDVVSVEGGEGDKARFAEHAD